MKKTRKSWLTFLFAAAFTVSAVPCRTEAMELPAAAEDRISPKTDNIIWVYKNIDGKWYRRLFNETQYKWIGDWEPVP